MSKATWMKIIGAVSVGAAATVSAVTMGTLPAVLVGVSAAAAWFAGLHHPAPGTTPAPEQT